MGELDSIDDELFAERIFPIGLVPPSLPEPPTVRFVEPPEPPRDRDPIMAIVTAALLVVLLAGIGLLLWWIR